MPSKTTQSKETQSKASQQKATTSSEGHKSAQVRPLLCEQFSIENLHTTELDTKSERAKSQYMAFVRYDYPEAKEQNFVFQIDNVKLTQYGMPTGDSEYYKTDDARSFVKLPLDPSQVNCARLERMLSSIDDQAINNKEKMLGKYAKLYTYSKLVREPSVKDEMDEINENEKKDTKKEEREKFKYCKLKFDLSFPDKEIVTQVYVNRDGKPVRVPIKNATELDEYLKWGSTIRCIVIMNKLWAAKAKDVNGLRQFGLSMKIRQIEITPREGGGGNEVLKHYAFIDDSTNEQTTDSTTVQANEGEAEAVEEVEEEVEEEVVEEEEETVEEEEEEEEEEEPEPEPEPTPPPKGKSGTKNAVVASPAKKTVTTGKKK
jgi:hypothetical protein